MVVEIELKLEEIRRRYAELQKEYGRGPQTISEVCLAFCQSVATGNSNWTSGIDFSRRHRVLPGERPEETFRPPPENVV